MVKHGSNATYSTILCWLLLLWVTLRDALGQSGGNGHLVNGILGELVKLPGIVPEAEPQSVTWYFTNRVGETTVACDKLINNPVACYFGARDRFTLNTSDYSLEIQSVGKGDWGRYDLTVISTTGNVSNLVVELHVYVSDGEPGILAPLVILGIRAVVFVASLLTVVTGISLCSKTTATGLKRSVPDKKPPAEQHGLQSVYENVGDEITSALEGESGEGKGV
eukprot:gi/632983565/ref/XP_007908710.1/ PREDICTED: uncharacterized protein LOC103189940 [Callorhinchus milii]